jgi:hypothetical protein
METREAAAPAGTRMEAEAADDHEQSRLVSPRSRSRFIVVRSSRTNQQVLTFGFDRCSKRQPSTGPSPRRWRANTIRAYTNHMGSEVAVGASPIVPATNA